MTRFDDMQREQIAARAAALTAVNSATSLDATQREVGEAEYQRLYQCAETDLEHVRECLQYARRENEDLTKANSRLKQEHRAQVELSEAYRKDLIDTREACERWIRRVKLLEDRQIKAQTALAGR